eukprot:9271128-Pyramimonas_sp.AAC.1
MGCLGILFGASWADLGGLLGRRGPLGPTKRERRNRVHKPVENHWCMPLRAIWKVLVGPAGGALGDT